MDKLPYGAMARIAIYCAAAVLGVIVFGAAATFVLGEVWPTLSYERALPAILIVAVIGGTVASVIARAAMRRRRG